jgi:hypothetical protein
MLISIFYGTNVVSLHFYLGFSVYEVLFAESSHYYYKDKLKKVTAFILPGNTQAI